MEISKLPETLPDRQSAKNAVKRRRPAPAAPPPLPEDGESPPPAPEKEEGHIDVTV